MPFNELECIKIEAAELEVDDRKTQYLHASGWKHTSQTVGSYWMWFKEVDGLHYGCDTADAFRIQNTLDRRGYAKAHPEEFDD